jgi:tetratricopeptide (TPR) repeat protein
MLIPLYSAVAPVKDESSFHEEMGGIASRLGVPRRNVLRALLSLAGGSTVFAATRTATADGQALIGRNVDWGDGFGRRKPIVAIYHPTNGDFDYIFTGWPLVGLPTVGLNEAGLAISLNFFLSEPRFSLLFPSWPHRSVLQKASTVEQAIEMIRKSGRRGLSAFYVLADATGDIAMVEWTPTDLAVFRPDGDWFGQANHARTEQMIQYDQYRHPDSFQRRAAMEAAVRPHVGNLTPELAVHIIRDRSGAAFANEPSVGNLYVLNPVVVHPASLTLWHSTVMQPHAPYGAFVPFTFSANSNPPTFPAIEAFVSGAFDKERAEIQAGRNAMKLHRDKRFEEARQAWDDLLASGPTTLNLCRLAVGRALTLYALNDPQGAYAALEPAVEPQAPFDVRGPALVSRGILADRLGLRNEAIQHYQAALEHFDSRPEFTTFAPTKETAARGLERPQAKTPLTLSVYDVGLPN